MVAVISNEPDTAQSPLSLGVVVIPEGVREWELSTARFALWLDVAEAWYTARAANPERDVWFDAVVALAKSAVRSGNFVFSKLGYPAGWSQAPKLRGGDPLVIYVRWLAGNFAADLAAKAPRLDLGQLAAVEEMLGAARDAGELSALLGAPQLDSERSAEGAGARPRGGARSARQAGASDQSTGESSGTGSKARADEPPAQPARRHGWRARLARG